MAKYQIKFTDLGESIQLISVRFEDPAPGNELLIEACSLLDSLALTGGALVLINGPMTLPVAFAIAHKVVHRYANVAVFDPKLLGYLVVANHGGRYCVGEIIRHPEP